MRFRKNGALIHRPCIYRQGDLPYAGKTININYQGHDPTLSGLCPCDYPVDAYYLRQTSSPATIPFYIEKWRLSYHNQAFFQWSSAPFFGTVNVLNCVVGWRLDDDGGYDRIWVLYVTPSGELRVVSISGVTGATEATVTQAQFLARASILHLPIKIFAPRRTGGVYLGSSSERLWKVNDTGPLSAPKIIPTADGTGFGDTTAAFYRRFAFAHSDGVIIGVTFGGNPTLFNDSLDRVGLIPTAVMAGGTGFLVSDQDGNIYSTRSCDSSLNMRVFETHPFMARMCMTNQAGVEPEASLGGGRPLVLAAGSPTSRLYNQETTHVWTWNNGLPGLPAGLPCSYFNSGGSNDDADQTDFTIVGDGRINRFNHYGTWISSSASARPGLTFIAAAGAEACVRGVSI